MERLVKDFKVMLPSWHCINYGDENLIKNILSYEIAIFMVAEWSRQEDAAVPVAEVMVGVKLRH